MFILYFISLYIIGTSLERKRNSDGDSSGSRLKRMLRSSVIRCGRIFTAAEKKTKSIKAYYKTGCFLQYSSMYG